MLIFYIIAGALALGMVSCVFLLVAYLIMIKAGYRPFNRYPH
jgi:hypothetical protein